MPRYQLQNVRRGYIRKNRVYGKSFQGNRQIKVGGKTYKTLVSRRRNNATLNNTSTKRKITKSYRKYLPKFYENKSVKSVRKLVKNYYQMTSNDKQITRQILQRSMRMNDGKRAVQFKYRGDDNFSNTMLTLRDDNLQDFVDVIALGGEIDNVQGVGSDTLQQALVREIEDFKIVDIERPQRPNRRIFNKNGNFFRHLNTTSINLERYQIVSENSDMKLLNDHCLTYALLQCGISLSLVNNIKTTFQTGSYFAKKNLNKVADIIKTTINLKTYNGVRNHITKYGKYENSINLALYEEHYFINEPTIYSLFSSKNYNSIKDEKDFHNITGTVGKYFKRGESKKIDSITLIKNLLETNNFIKDHPLIKKRDEYQRYKDKTETLSIIDDEQQLYEYEDKTEKNKNKNRSVFFADTETDTTDNHKPILIGVMKDTKEAKVRDVKIYSNDDNSSKFFMNFLDYVHKNSKTDGKNDDEVLIYFHNLKYDYHVLLPYLYHSGAPCEKDGQYYNSKILWKGRTFELRDSYKLASFPLSKFQKTFQLAKDFCKKEAIAYEYHKLDNMKKYKVKVSSYEKFLNDEEKKTFRHSLRENWGVFEYEKNNKNVWYFNPVEYYKYYLKYDVYVLYKGIRKFKETIDHITDNRLNMYNYLTISSLTNAYMGMSGVFNGIYEISGNLREFISKAITGGRVQVNEKYVKKVIEGMICDYDGVSLYPSAIKRMCDEIGLPKGKAKQIKVFTKQLLDKFDYYIVKVKITKINKYQQLPMVSYKDDEGILQYTNNLEEPIISYIDMITLQDWIEFQGIEYEILDGVYWNEGYNKKMGECIYHLFQERLKQKKAGNQALQQILKLMMNSSYGKTIIKKSNTHKVIVKENEKDDYFYNNFRTIKEMTPLYNGQYLFKMDKMDDSYNMAHIGVLVLSYSKRIMNEVFDIANTFECPLYYTDTDSIHCNYNDVKTIETEFRNKYNRELTGKQLGQFHIDFDLEGSASEIYATKSIFLGKKCYIDKLESKDKKGNTINGYHYRMKGVTVQGLLDCSEQNFNNDLFQLYEYLSQGEELEIVLNPKGKKVMFNYDEYEIFTRGSGTFRRTVQF